MAYNTEEYWDQVASEIGRRKEARTLAGDDEPYYHYKRKLFLRLLNSLDVEGKNVLEIGSGPGGNLAMLSKKNCRRLAGVDISEKMIALSRKELSGTGAEIFKTNGTTLPFESSGFDLVFTSTVLQHNTNEKELGMLIQEICRVSASEVYLFERIEKKIRGHESNTGRPVKYYADLFLQNGFHLEYTKFLPIQASYYACGIIRKLFNRRSRKEGEQVSRISYLLENLALPLTRILDPFIPSRRDLGMLYFKKISGKD